MSKIFGLLWPWLKPRRPGWALAASAVLSLASQGIAGPTLAQAGDPLTQAVEKRYFFTLVNDRCHLLNAPATTALKAGFVQARNAAIRSGRDMSALAPALDQARAAAAATDCHAPQVTAEMGNAQSALRSFVTQMRLDLPGSRATWSGVRADQDTSEWRLVQYQNTSGADLAFGLFGTLAHNSLSVMARFADGTPPYAARILVRDPDHMASGLIDTSAPGIAAHMPWGFGDATSLSFMAYDQSDVTATLRPAVKVNFAGFAPGGGYVGAQAPVDAQRFDFPKAALLAMARLDPREDVVIEFECPDGPRYARFEVGDVITGLAYISLPSPYSHGQS